MLATVGATALMVVLAFGAASLIGLAQVPFLANLAAYYPNRAVELGRRPSGLGASIDRLTVRQWWVVPGALYARDRALVVRAIIAAAARVLWWLGLVLVPVVGVVIAIGFGADVTIVGSASLVAWALTGPIAYRHDTVRKLPEPNDEWNNGSAGLVTFYFLPGLVIGTVLLAFGFAWVVSALRG